MYNLLRGQATIVVRYTFETSQIETNEQINLTLWGKRAHFQLIWKSCQSDKVPGLVAPLKYLLLDRVSSFCCFYWYCYHLPFLLLVEL